MKNKVMTEEQRRELEGLTEGKDYTVGENGIITYNIKPHNVEIKVKWEFNYGGGE